MKSVGDKLKLMYQHMTEDTLKSSRQILTFGILMSINFPAYLLIWHQATPQDYQNTALRLVATGVCLILLGKNYWPKRLMPYLPLYWYFVVLFTLPFFFVFMTLKNSGSVLWLMNLMSALFFVFLLFDFISAFALLFVGSVLAVLAYTLTTSGGFVFNPGIVSASGLFVTFLAAMIIGGFFARNRALMEYEKLATLKLLGACIAHELRTPFASITGAMNGLKKYLPLLFDAYDKANANNLDVQSIRTGHYDLIKRIPTSVCGEINNANNTIDMLLLNISQADINKEKFMQLSVSKSIEESLARYPFRSSEHRTLVNWTNECDFMFYGDKQLFTHIMFNLLKNALYFVEAERKGDIHIWIKTADTQNIIYFKDTAKGAPAEVVVRLFESFYSKRQNGTGLGLAFCKKVMKSFGGDIRAESVDGEYMQFSLHFPALKNKQ